MAENKSWWKAIGPGILFAGTAIGVSHLVQSTRAGAEYGWLMLGVILLANLLKYPFFEFGARYAAYTGHHLLHGYRQLSKAFLVLYLVLSLATLFTVSAAVTMVTAGLLTQVLPGFTPWQLALGLYIVFWLVLVVGRYRWLDLGIKVMGGVLLITTLAAFVGAALQGATAPEAATPSFALLWEPQHLFFVVALVGWMPTALDISSWHSLWTVARNRDAGKAQEPGGRSTIMDFNLGYALSALTALCFLALGRWLLYGTGATLPASAGGFAQVIIDLFTQALGSWARPVVLAAAITTMLSTSLTVLDGYSRVMQEGIRELKPRWVEGPTFFRVFAALMAVGGLLIIRYFTGHLRSLVDLAMVISFLISPIIALINYRLVTHAGFPQEGRPGRVLKGLAWLGMVFLLGFAAVFVSLFFFS